VRDPAVLERRSLIRAVMGDFQVELDLERFALEWFALQELALDGLVELSEARGRGLARVTLAGRWLIRTIATVFDPEQARSAPGSRLI
jgi:oxygen-independent coproporphyrinogen-3 oxidase